MCALTNAHSTLLWVKVGKIILFSSVYKSMDAYDFLIKLNKLLSKIFNQI